MTKAFDPNAAAASDGIFGLPYTAEESRVVLIPVPWEATVSYGAGTAQGPAAILAASRQVDLFDRETGRPYEAGIAMLPPSEMVREWNRIAREAALPLIEKGGSEGSPEDAALVEAVEKAAQSMNGYVYAEAKRLLEEGKLVGVIGGDHASPFGAIRAVLEKYPEAGVLHVDAHADLRDAYEGFTYSHASIFHNVVTKTPLRKLVQVAIRDLCDEEFKFVEANAERIRVFYDPDIKAWLHEGTPWAALADQIVAELPPEVYVSFDIDGLDPALCPHTGTPVPGGLDFPQATSLFKKVAASGRKIVGFDLCETVPDPTGASEWDANVAARLLYKLIGFALK
ncbi:MAG TPA: agmatinase family protein [Thermoanaerobaculia bacterium]|nr:agmatinase family protein [Thermoanaerobaculia bacterium]